MLWIQTREVERERGVSAGEYALYFTFLWLEGDGHLSKRFDQLYDREEHDHVYLSQVRMRENISFSGDSFSDGKRPRQARDKRKGS